MENNNYTSDNNENKELSMVPTQTKKFALATMDVENVGSALRENLGGQGLSPFDFAKLSFPTAGGTHWDVVDPLSGEQQAKKELVGVVFHQSTSRAYWAAEFAGEGVQPDCFSNDGIVGHGDPGGPCRSCLNNRFGSKGRGKACKETREIYILQEENYLPLVISAPPSSIKIFHNFCVHLGIQGINLHEAVIKFGLTSDKNAEGIKYSKLRLQFFYRLSPEDSEQLKKFRASFLEAVAIDVSSSTNKALKDASEIEITDDEDIPM
jgi:hypothetical protein